MNSTASAYLKQCAAEYTFDEVFPDWSQAAVDLLGNPYGGHQNNLRNMLVSAVSFALEGEQPEETFVLFGPAGFGKSAFLAALVGDIPDWICECELEAPQPGKFSVFVSNSEIRRRNFSLIEVMLPIPLETVQAKRDRLWAGAVHAMNLYNNPPF